MRRSNRDKTVQRVNKCHVMPVYVHACTRACSLCVWLHSNVWTPNNVLCSFPVVAAAEASAASSSRQQAAAAAAAAASKKQQQQQAAAWLAAGASSKPASSRFTRFHGSRLFTVHAFHVSRFTRVHGSRFFTLHVLVNHGNIQIRQRQTHQKPLHATSR